MALLNGCSAINFDVYLDEVQDATLPDSAFFHGTNSIDACSYGSHLIFKVLGWCNVQNITHGNAHQLDATVGNDGTSHEGRPIVGSFVTWPAYQANRDANKGGYRSQRVGAMVPGIRLQRRAIYCFTYLADPTSQRFFNNDYQQQDD